MSIIPLMHEKSWGETILESLILQWTKETEEIETAKDVEELSKKTKVPNPIRSSGNYVIYKKPVVPGVYIGIAYECPKCQKIVIGPPILKYKNDMGGLAGSERIETYCKNCDSQLDETTIAMS